MTNLQPAIKYFGSQANLARAMGLDPMAVTQWKRRGLPLKRAIEISILTKGAVKPADLLPHVFIIPGMFDSETSEKIPIPANKRSAERRTTERRTEETIT